MKTTHDRQDTYSTLAAVRRLTPCNGHRMRTKPWKSAAASCGLTRLDRVAVLGENDHVQGHSGCVNALHWSSDGSVLVSAGDDTRIHLWRLDPSNVPGDYPLSCTAKIHTGHTNNIFNAHILPGSSRIATCAADRQVRVFDVNRGGLSHHSGGLTVYQERQACLRILKCHHGRVKRVITENSPDYFLTVAEDGSVRQHDLRTPHKCSKDSCPSPLVKLPLELSTIALSSLTPYNFVVAGESPYAYLFDRRQIGRHLKEAWGVACRPEDLTSCVRRFGRRKRAKSELAGRQHVTHVTGSRMSEDNGHELLLTYSADAAYLYSTRDPPETPQTSQQSMLLSNNRSPLATPSIHSAKDSGDTIHAPAFDDAVLDETDTLVDLSQDSSHGETENEENYESQYLVDIPENLRLPVVYPRTRYVGACNVQTVKDINFVGPRDEYVVSGSDDGNFFMWDKGTGKLVDIHEGDGSIVNVIEQHPSLPILSVSGLDHTVKIFAPSSVFRHSSRMSQAADIVKNNALQTSERFSVQRIRLSDLVLSYRRAWTGAGEPEEAECVHQ